MQGMTLTINGMELEDLTKEIKRTMRRSAKDAVQLGYMLRRVLEERMYLENYGCFDDYIGQELQMDYTMASRFIGINKKFSFAGKSMEIDQKYEQYSQGLLIEMLNMTPEQEAKVTAEMTVKQAREIKRQSRPQKPVPEPVVPAAMKPEQEEVIIDGEFREIREPEKVATSQPENKILSPQSDSEISPFGCGKSEYPTDSRIKSEGCGNRHSCFICAQNCKIRGENRYCVEAPMGNPFYCVTMDVLEKLQDAYGERCQFVNQDLAYHRAGDGEADPCCKECRVHDCQYRCSRAADILREEIGGHKSGEEQEEPEPETTGDYKGIEFVRRILRENQKLLKDYLDVGGLPAETVEKQRVITGALAAMVSDLEQIAPEQEEADREPIQPEFPVLKNNDQRKEWLARYKDWGLWYRDEHIDVNYYKYDFPDGSRLVASEYPKRISYWSMERRDEYYFHLLEKNKKGHKETYDESYRHSPDSETYLVEFLKNLQKLEKEK